MAGIDGDSFSFLSEPEFSNTTFYLPSPANRPAGLSWVQNIYNSIVNKLTTANKSYTVLSNDITIHLSVNARIKTLCANAADIQAYLTDKAIDENEYSVQAILYHGNNKFFFAGDAERFEIPYTLANYDLEAVDVYKINHHAMLYQVTGGAGTEYIRAVAEKTSPKFAISTINKKIFVENEANVLTIHRHALNAFVAVGAKCYQTIESIAFESNGFSVANLSSYAVGTVDKNSDTLLDIYIDGTNTSGIWDGTPEHPFPNFESALQFIPQHQNASTINLMVADGVYEYFSANHLTVPIYLYFNNNAVTIKNFKVKSCSKIEILNSVTINRIRIDSSPLVTFANVTLDSTNTQDDTQAVEVTFSNVYFGGILTYLGRGNDSSKFVRCGSIYQGVLSIQTLTIKNEGEAALQRGMGGILLIRTLNAENVGTCLVQGGSGAGILLVRNIGSLTNVGGVIRGVNQNGAEIVNTPYMDNHYGASNARPPVFEVKIGHYYYDTTLRKMLISNGTNWIDTTTGNTI
jgi:hypothetical protein